MLATDPRGVIVPCPACGQKNRRPFSRLATGLRCAKCKTPLPPPAAPAEISSVETFDALLAHSPVPVVVDFWAPWCGPCHMMAPELDKVAASHAGRLLVAKVDTEAIPALGARFSIRSIPTVAVFESGRLLGSEAGARPARDIERVVTQMLGRTV